MVAKRPCLVSRHLAQLLPAAMPVAGVVVPAQQPSQDPSAVLAPGSFRVAHAQAPTTWSSRGAQAPCTTDSLRILLAHSLHRPQQVPTFNWSLRACIEEMPLPAAARISRSVTELHMQTYMRKTLLAGNRLLLAC
jgi:hypothetical protein